MLKRFKGFLRDLFYSLYLRYAGQFRTAQQVAEAKMHGNALDAIERQVVTAQTKCTHRKGGIIVHTINKETGQVECDVTKCLGGGISPQYSVMKHQMMNGDWRVRCTRCGKTWATPIRQEYRNEHEFVKAIEEYGEAINFPTNNKSSTSLQFSWKYRNGSDAREFPRKAMAARF